MSSSLSVDLNHSRLHEIAVVDEFSADGPFSIELSNEGEAAHVHLHLDDDLSRVARLEAGNHYVEADAIRPVRVDVDADAVTAPVSGKLKIVTGYGSEQEYVDVTVEPPSDHKEPVDVDERLSNPPPRDPEPERARSEQLLRLVQSADGESVALVAFGVLAVLGAITVGLLLESPVVLLGVGIVIGVALAGVVLALR